jgi:hypothetical protein
MFGYNAQFKRCAIDGAKTLRVQRLSATTGVKLFSLFIDRYFYARSLYQIIKLYYLPLMLKELLYLLQRVID